jgi:hypothetical protein
VEWLVARMKSLGYDDAFVDEAGNAVGVMGKGTKQVVLLGILIRCRARFLFEKKMEFYMGAARWMRKVRWRVLWMRWQRSVRRMAGSLWSLARWKKSEIRKAQDLWQKIQTRLCDHRRAESMGSNCAWIQRQRVGECDRQTRAGAHRQRRRDCGRSGSGSLVENQSLCESFNEDKKRVFDKLLLTLRGMDSDSNDFEQWALLKLASRLPVEVSPEDWYARLGEPY